MTADLRTESKPAANKGLAKVVVHCFIDSPDSYRDVVNQTLILRINPDSYRDGENRDLRQARNR